MSPNWLPTTKKEVEQRGWQQLDVILFSGDAYVDHPAFGVAVIGRLLESLGLRVAIVPQPDWHGDYRDFRKLGRPRYFFGISPGAMDSMVNKYTAARRLRSEDAYSPDGRHDKRPEYPTIVYTHILKQLWPDAPVVLGGIEASMRRLTHYDYWQQRLRPSILIDSGADLITYGLGEQPTEALVRLIDDKLLHGRDDAFASAADLRQLLHKYPIPQTVRIVRSEELGVRSEELGVKSEELGVRSEHAQCVKVSASLYERIAYRGSTEGVIALVRSRSLTLADLQLGEAPLVMVLERVEKPGNLGAVLRSADAAGVDAVIVCDPLTDLYNPNLIRSSIGAVFTVPCVACSSDECIAWLKDNDISILTAQLQDSSLYYDTNMTGPTAIVMGTEATGLTEAWRQAADAHIRIPMLGRLDSLNVSVSAAILLYEAVRQRTLKS